MTDVLTDISPAAPAARASTEGVPATRASRLRLGIILLVVAAAATWGIRTWLASRLVVTSDNAQVDGHITPIAPKVQAFVSRVLVEDNQEVKAGDTLVVLDPRDLELRLQQARADLGSAQAQAGSGRNAGQAAAQLAMMQAQAAGSEASVAVAEAAATKAAADLERYRGLAATRVIAAQQLDAAQAANDAAIANLDVARRQAIAAKSQVAAGAAALKGADARLAAAAAAVGTAETQLSYTVITAPIAGVVARRRVEPGELVQPGQALLSIVPSADVWVTANLKETELQSVKVGDPVEFTVDAYRGLTFKGTVESLSPATGARFALLPPDNASGNFTKVVQRVPVRIAVPGQDPAHPLRPGMSVDVKIRVK
jgi:membrane fusion protein (multidrug efflux system)